MDSYNRYHIIFLLNRDMTFLFAVTVKMASEKCEMILYCISFLIISFFTMVFYFRIFFTFLAQTKTRTLMLSFYS